MKWLERRKLKRYVFSYPIHRWQVRKRVGDPLFCIQSDKGFIALYDKEHQGRIVAMLYQKGQPVGPAEDIFRYLCGRWSRWRLFGLYWRLWWSKASAWTRDQWEERRLVSRMGEDEVVLEEMSCDLCHEWHDLSIGGIRVSRKESWLYRHINRKIDRAQRRST